jgi:hypothetical protein
MRPPTRSIRYRPVIVNNRTAADKNQKKRTTNYRTDTLEGGHDTSRGMRRVNERRRTSRHTVAEVRKIGRKLLEHRAFFSQLHRVIANRVGKFVYSSKWRHFDAFFDAIARVCHYAVTFDEALDELDFKPAIFADLHVCEARYVATDDKYGPYAVMSERGTRG